MQLRSANGVITAGSTAQLKPKASTRPRYRNDVVYRSAERLLVAPPKKPHGKLLPYSIGFLLGITCGLGAAFWLLGPIRESAPNPDTVTSATYGGPTRFNLPSEGAQRRSGPVPVVFSASGTDSEESRGAARDVALAGSRQVATARPTARRATATPSIATPVPAPSATILTQATTHFKLRGEMRVASTKVIHVEFELFLLPDRLGGSVQGFVRFIDDPNLAQPLSLTGVWINRTLTLREGGKAAHDTHPPSPAGRTFVIEFPSPDGSEEITGLWTYGTTHGTLALKSVLPL